MQVSDGNRDGNGGSRQQSEAATDSQLLQLIRSELGIRYTRSTEGWPVDVIALPGH